MVVPPTTGLSLLRSFSLGTSPGIDQAARACSWPTTACEVQGEMDWRADLEAAPMPIPRRRCYVCTVYILCERLRSHSIYGSGLCAAWVAVPFRYLGTLGPGSPPSLHRIAWYSWDSSVHRQARARRCRDMYRHIRAPENPSMRGGGQRQRKSLLRNGEARRLILKAGQAQGSARQGWRRQV